MSTSPTATDPAFLSARELLAGFRARILSPVEALEAALARLAATIRRSNAFHLVDAEMGGRWPKHRRHAG